MQVMIYIPNQDIMDSIRSEAVRLKMSVSAYLLGCHENQKGGRVSRKEANPEKYKSHKPEKSAPKVDIDPREVFKDYPGPEKESKAETIERIKKAIDTKTPKWSGGYSNGKQVGKEN